jgi:hypothetical protein
MSVILSAPNGRHRLGLLINIPRRERAKLGTPALWLKFLLKQSSEQDAAVLMISSVWRERESRESILTSRHGWKIAKTDGRIRICYRMNSVFLRVLILEHEDAT